MSEQSTLSNNVALGAEDNHLVDLQTMFLQSASHELRTPLNSVLGYSELLCEGYLGELVPEQSEAITIIRDSARALNKVVERLTLLMSAQAGGLGKVEMGITDIVEDIVGDRVQDAMAKNVYLDMVIEPELPTIMGDEAALAEAIDCLVENAVKFTPAGGEIGVQLYKDSGWLWLAIQDNGPGIPIEVQPYIFDRFYQADGRLVREFEGLGLGLAVAREVFEALGGQIRLYSTPGYGSCFTIKLPTADYQLKRKLKISSKRAPASQAQTIRKKDRLWFIDWIPHQPC